MVEYEISDQLGKDGKVIDKIAKITINHPQIIQKSKTELEREKADKMNQISSIEAEILDIDEILGACE